MKVAVLTDSTAYIPSELRKKYNIHLVYLSVVFDDKSYREEVDITTTEFYEKMRGAKELPTTSQPSVGQILEKYEELADEYDAVISIHLSSKISGTYQAAVSAGKMVEGIKVYTYDSEYSCMVQGFYVLEAAQMAQQGKSPEEILARLEDIKQSVKAYFMVDDLTNLQKGGRLSNAQALIGSMLKIKPILHMVEGEILPFEKIRTRKKAISRIMGMLEEDAQQKKISKVVFIHGNDEDAAIELRDQFLKQYPHFDTYISYFGPVIGTHLGEHSLGIAWY